MSAMVLGLNVAYATGHENLDEGNAEAYELLGTYLQEQEPASAITTYTFYDSASEKIAEYTVENDALNPELNKLINKSDLLLEDGKQKVYMID